jgi:predicted metal-binding membrane protein
VTPAAAQSRPLLLRIVAREQRVVLVCLGLMCALAWYWLWQDAAGGTTGTGTLAMGGMTMPAVQAGVWSLAYLGPAFAMWAIMMVAMMLPSAAPLILLYAALSKRNTGSARLATLLFASTYLLVWITFAALATIGQAALVGRGLADAATLALGNRAIVAGLLAATALYQISSLKTACLSKCRAPVNFLMQHWRPGYLGAVRMGVIHGSYCVGCCVFLMLLLFVGGVMNLALIFLITAVVLIEKYAPPMLHARRIITAILFAAAAALAIA